MNCKLLLSVVFLVAATPAFAADLAPAPIEPIGPVAAPFSWNGFYVGADIGYSWASVDSTLVNSAVGLSFDTSPNADGVVGGLYVGYNAQFNQIVVGLEADAEISSGSGDDTIGPFASLGGTSLSKVQFGAEHARQMGDTYIDDVVVRG